MQNSLCSGVISYLKLTLKGLRGGVILTPPQVFSG